MSLLDFSAVELLYLGKSEPPFPARHLPPDYSLSEIQRFYGRKIEEGRDAFLSYYKKVNL